MLGDCGDTHVLDSIFGLGKVDTVVHAAAFKHVPIVEDNFIAGITNNVFGTKCLADFAHRFGVDKFILISTDKAVRPTNVMGATKRLAELVVQDLSKSSDTIFTMVRFGNVLGSSGSVIPKFKSQINVGGPITVTHEEIMRYFMSIPEAAHLVLNAGTFARGGEVFLLDMGNPVKIVELAKSMIRQHGLQPVLASEIKQRQKRDNEILMEFTGLRPGEKLYEELLVDGVAQKTPNPKIFKSDDGVLEELDIAKALRLLEKNIQDGHYRVIIKQLRDLPLSYQPSINSESNQTINEKADRAKTVKSVSSLEKNVSANLVTYSEHPSLFVRFISSKLGLSILHRYFLMIRGMTLGVRVLVKNNKDEILLVRHAYLPGWHLPGGGVDPGEDVETAAGREVFEETGISQLSELKFKGVFYNKNVSFRDHVVFFTACTKNSVTIANSSEISMTAFFNKNQMPATLDPAHSDLISEVVR